MENGELERRQPLARLGVEVAEDFLDLGKQGVIDAGSNTPDGWWLSIW